MKDEKWRSGRNEMYEGSFLKDEVSLGGTWMQEGARIESFKSFLEVHMFDQHFTEHLIARSFAVNHWPIWIINPSMRLLTTRNAE